jgi:HAD superfamily hydrolase (TIGR01509 family)
MPKLTDFSAFIFDMDGLVLDTEPTYFAAWQQAVEKMGFRGDADAFKTLSGHHYSHVEARLLTWYGHDFNLQTFRQLGSELWRNHVKGQGIAVKPGVVALLGYAGQQRIPVCLATNSSAINAHECLAIAGIRNSFPVIVTGDDVQRVKPEPDIFLKAADRMQVDIQHCLVFEDSHTGIVAASAAGAYSVYVPSTLPVDPLTVAMCDCMMDDLSQVFESLPDQTAIGI